VNGRKRFGELQANSAKTAPPIPISHSTHRSSKQVLEAGDCIHDHMRFAIRRGVQRFTVVSISNV